MEQENSITSDIIHIYKCKPDHLTKVFLMLAMLRDIEIKRKDIIDFLNLNNKKDKGIKRKYSKIVDIKSEIVGNNATSSEIASLCDYMGPNPILVSKEKGEYDVNIELIMSTPPEKFVTENITHYTFDINNDNITDRLLSRIKIILNEINTVHICKEIKYIVKIIRDKEKEEGYNKIIDKKSSQRIIRKLVTEGYIKVFQVHISNDNLKRMEVFICHPRVNHDNDVIKAQIQQTVWKHFGCGDRKIVLSKPVIKANDESKISPFGRKDVQASIRELKCLNQNKQITMKMISSSKSGKLYGYRPKFSRMSILHELLFYLIYELDTQAQALSKAETLSLFQSYQINLTHEDLEKLPPVFNKELSWKMFIPPLPHHQYWNHGWALICDVILRMPVSLITKVHCISYYSTELLDMLHHPIKRFYMLKNLSPQLHNVIMYRRKYIHSIYETIARLGYCGLVQFGPSKYQEKDQIFLYLNRRASLLETMDSEPAYHKVTVKNYNKVEFTFNTMDDILKYWSTLHTISMNTPLNSRYIMSGKTITLEKEKGKICLQKVFDVRTQEEAKNLDNGTIPGDHRGAAGLDSALWSHIKRNWFYFGKDYKNLKFTDDLESLKFDQVVKRERVSFEQLKVPSGSTKFFIPKSQVVGNLTKRNKLKGHRESRIIKRKMPIRKVSKSMKNVYDDVDKAIYKKYKGSMRFKPSWSGEEDKLLIILKIAAKFLSPKKPKLAINNTTLRDILHRVLPASLNKTTSAIPRRWKILKRDIPSIMNIDFWNEYNSTGKPFKLSDAELQNAFIFLCYYIITHRKEVETTLDGNMTTVDYFKSDNIEFIKSNLVSVYSSDTKYMDPVDKDGIRKSVLKKLFHSVLGGRKEDPAWSYQLYQVFQKFSDSSLKSVIAELKEQKMMTYKKDMIKKFHTPYKIGLQYIFSQCTIFNYNTVEEAYYTFSSVKSKALQFDRNYVEEKNYGQLIAVHEMTTVLWNNITLKFNIPENPFILNPDIVDHSELIEELAKRYQVKLKNEAKEVELSIHAENANKNTDLIISAEVFEQPETSQLDDDYEPLDLTVSADSETINNLKHWISDCIDTERVRSPSPDLLMFQDDNKIHMPIKEEVFDSENATVEDYRILSLDEIKKEMLRVTSKEEKRNVPYITDLTKLLTENFDEIETDELTIDRLKKHFVQQYPSLVTFEADASHNSITESIENKMKLNNLWQTFFNKQRIILPLQPTLIIEEILNKHGRNPADIDLINHIITFIDEKNVLGATGQELKNEFQKSDNINSLISIINTLLHYNIIIKVGICCIRFIHYTYASEWLLESFNLNDTHTVVQDDDGFDELRQQIDSNMKVTSWIKIKLQPWIKVDGTVNKDLVRLWLSTILSYCTENPKLSLRRLCNKFSFMAPVDIYHLLEVLEELGCLEIRRFLPSPVSLFSEFEISEDTKATFLDNFEDMFIDLKYMPFTSLGAFLHNMIDSLNCFVTSFFELFRVYLIFYIPYIGLENSWCFTRYTESFPEIEPLSLGTC
ncbi:hypothetical protein GWI33_007129 [Rhynchophorus ferrugineus]|uniref:GTF3C1 extended winged-helix domain-containing protein n=1 Tax=Rhynchophorus ferrugineus TaxID=354439 RepID=A0A834J2D8_RHYFE|nr:hypothetical protein GWI33_007129 [Rhynchophorus ferrugineus]